MDVKQASADQKVAARVVASLDFKFARADHFTALYNNEKTLEVWGKQISHNLFVRNYNLLNKERRTELQLNEDTVVGYCFGSNGLVVYCADAGQLRVVDVDEDCQLDYMKRLRTDLQDEDAHVVFDWGDTGGR